MLLLLLVMPAALLLMVCMLERYERLIEAPTRPQLDDEVTGVAVPQTRTPELASALAAEIGPELAPEAA